MSAFRERGAILGVACAAIGASAALTACGGGEGDASGDPDAPPAVSIALASSDDRRANRDTVFRSGKRTTLRGRVTRRGAPVRRERVELLVDPYPFGDGERVAASTTTRRDGRFAVRRPFGRNARVRARLAGDRSAASEPVSIYRSAHAFGAEIVELPDGRNRLTGLLGYPRDVEPTFRFRMYIGLSSDRRLARRPARVRVARVRPGRSRVIATFSAPDDWRMQLCVIPNEGSGLSPPRVGCRGPSVRNTERKVDRDEREEERRREQDAGAAR